MLVTGLNRFTVFPVSKYTLRTCLDKPQSAAFNICSTYIQNKQGLCLSQVCGSRDLHPCDQRPHKKSQPQINSITMGFGQFLILLVYVHPSAIPWLISLHNSLCFKCGSLQDIGLEQIPTTERLTCLLARHGLQPL